ncbi:unnamed protein product [Debaryomyces fabryi]|nr:unnamed protein product [Debaryomyces fabryi]
MNSLKRVGRFGCSIRRNALINNLRHLATSQSIVNHALNDQHISVSKARIRPNIFTSRSTGNSIKYVDLPMDTYPNPLFNMSKDEILELNSQSYLHLLNIPYRSISETDKFCLSIIEIANEFIILDTKKVTKLLINIKDTDMASIITSTLRKYFINDRVKSSILEFMDSPISDNFREGFFNNISHILELQDKGDDQKSEILLSYLNKLALVGSVNKRPLILNKNFYDKIISVVPESRYAEFYSYLLNLNIQTYATQQLDSLKYKLIMGSNLEKFVVRTGWMNSKWHDVQRPDFDSIHQEKMIQFFSIKDLKMFALFAIKKEDIVDATLYLNLIVSKFEGKCKQRMESDFTPGLIQTTLQADIQSVLNVILSYIMAFKGSQSCIKVLKYMVKNHLDVKFENLLTIMNNLRDQGYFQEALLLMNNIDLKSLNNTQLLNLIEEILKLIKEKYPTSPKILIGYVSSMFSGKTENLEDNMGLSLLDDLNLLSVVYSGGEIGKLSQSLSIVQKANVDDSLTGFEFTANGLTHVYEIILNSLPSSQITPNYILKLYEAYILMIMISKDSTMNIEGGNQLYVFYENNLNDHVITIFMKYLLKLNPTSADMDLVTSEANFEAAKYIIDDFLSKVDLKRSNRSVYLFDLLIYSSLLVHQDYKFASKMIRASRSYGLPFSFNQIYPFIMFHYYRNEYKQAELWYRELVKHGVRSKATPTKNLFKIARELNWDVSGFVYRKFGIHKNYRKREELAKLQRDPVLFIEDNQVEDEVTEELIDVPSNHHNDFNFSDELTSILHQADLIKGS